MSANKPVTPVKPMGMEIVFLYPCPFCERQVPLLGPTQPDMAQCDSCGKRFPVVPVDSKTLRYYKIMLAGGKAGVDPDFI